MHLAGEDKNKIPDIIKKKEWKQMVISVHNGGFFLNMDRHGALAFKKIEQKRVI